MMSKMSMLDYLSKGKDKRPASSSVSTDDEVSKPPQKTVKSSQPTEEIGTELSSIKQCLETMCKTMLTMCTEETLKTELNNLETKIISKFDQKLEKMRSDLHGLEIENQDLKVQLQDVQTKLDDSIERIKTLERKTNDTEERAIRNEQYSRRSNIRITGLKETGGENSVKVAVKLFSEKLTITVNENDIDAAHRIPRADTSKPRPMIIKFLKRTDRDSVIKARSKLKGTGITIMEDLAKENQRLLVRVASKPGIVNTWSHNGKILAKLKDNSIHEITRHTDLNALVASHEHPKETVS